MLATITEWSFGFGALGCLAGAVAAFIYLPFVGRYIASALVAVAAGLFAYDAGYAARGQLDQSDAISAQLDATREQLDATKTIQIAADSRAQQSEQQAAQLQEQIDAYASAIAAKDAAIFAPPVVPSATPAPAPVPDCLLSPDDVRVFNGLQHGSGSGHKAHAAGGAR